MTGPLPTLDPRIVRARRLFLLIITAACVVLVPWIGYLVLRLPKHYVSTHWNVAWVGFDVLLVMMLGLTALAGWRRRLLVIPGAVLTATLLVCDAWFDIVLDWGSPDLVWSIVAAAAGELPLALLMYIGAHGISTRLVRSIWQQGGHEGTPPSVWRARLPELMGVRLT